MNAAQAYHVSRLYRRPELLRPFTQHGFGEIGERLVRMVFATPDRGHRSDMAATGAWATERGLEGCFVWTPYAERHEPFARLVSARLQFTGFNPLADGIHGHTQGPRRVFDADEGHSATPCLRTT